MHTPSTFAVETFRGGFAVRNAFFEAEKGAFTALIGRAHSLSFHALAALNTPGDVHIAPRRRLRACVSATIQRKLVLRALKAREPILEESARSNHKAWLDDAASSQRTNLLYYSQLINVAKNEKLKYDLNTKTCNAFRDKTIRS